MENSLRQSPLEDSIYIIKGFNISFSRLYNLSEIYWICSELQVLGALKCRKWITIIVEL